jgi:Cu+-exporting ATPase
MDPAAVWVTTGGLVLAVAVNLYFFSPRRATMASPAAAEGAQEVRVVVRGDYQPSLIEVRVGRPVRLVFHREEVAGCSDTVMLPAWGIVQRLPAYQDTVIEFTPQHPGEYEFTCGMRMLRGQVVVR